MRPEGIPHFGWDKGGGGQENSSSEDKTMPGLERAREEEGRGLCAGALMNSDSITLASVQGAGSGLLRAGSSGFLCAATLADVNSGSMGYTRRASGLLRSVVALTTADTRSVDCA